MQIVVMPGDDIGPEITEVTLTMLEKVNRAYALGMEFELVDVGMASFKKCGNTIPESAVEKALAADGVILGPCGMTLYPPREAGGVNVPGTIRKRLELYANLRPARSRPGVPNARPGLDVLIARENTEGFYSDRNMHMGIADFMPTEDVALSVRKITRAGSRRIAKVAFEYAARRRKNVTAVGKQHVLQATDGLFMSEAYAQAELHKDIAFREVDVDAMAADLYTRPRRYDVILVTNMFGDILSNEAVALSGGLGLAAALNAGDEHAIANAGHGSAPDLVGRGIANPSGLMLSVAMLLEWLGARHKKPAFIDASRALEAALDAALADARVRTPELGGDGTTRSFAQAVTARVDAGELRATATR
jgi:isocitrate/isopropylmalate dehydrogenase